MTSREKRWIKQNTIEAPMECKYCTTGVYDDCDIERDPNCELLKRTVLLRKDTLEFYGYA